MASVLALGLDPNVVDAQAVSGLAPDLIRAFIDTQLDRIRACGYDVESCLVDGGDTAESVLTHHLRTRTFDCVMIGAGLRAPERLLLFENLLNVVHALAPAARICFNTSPADSVDAVQRWLGPTAIR
jgi:hypothetical protein